LLEHVFEEFQLRCRSTVPCKGGLQSRGALIGRAWSIPRNAWPMCGMLPCCWLRNRPAGHSN